VAISLITLRTSVSREEALRMLGEDLNEHDVDVDLKAGVSHDK